MAVIVTVETVTATHQVAAFRVEAPEGATAVAEITIVEAAADTGAAKARRMVAGVDLNLKEDTLREDLKEETVMAAGSRATVAVEVTVVVLLAAPVVLPSATKRILCSWEA